MVGGGFGILLVCPLVGWLNTAVGVVEERLWTIDIEARDRKYGDLDSWLPSSPAPWLVNLDSPFEKGAYDWEPSTTLTEGAAADPASGVNDRPICRVTLKMTGEAEDVNKKIIAEACIAAEKVETFVECGVIKGGEGGTVSVPWKEEALVTLDGKDILDVWPQLQKDNCHPNLFAAFDFFALCGEVPAAVKTLFNLSAHTVCEKSAVQFTPCGRLTEIKRLLAVAIQEKCVNNITTLQGNKVESLGPNAFCLQALEFDPTKFEHKLLKELQPSTVLTVFSQGEDNKVLSKHAVFHDGWRQPDEVERQMRRSSRNMKASSKHRLNKHGFRNRKRREMKERKKS